MPHKKIDRTGGIRYDIMILCNLGFFGKFTADVPIAQCYTGTVLIQHAKVLEKKLCEGVKEHLGHLNMKFNQGDFRLHFKCKIETSSGKPRLMPRKSIDKNIIIEKIVATTIKKLHKRLVPFFRSTQKDLSRISIKMAQIVDDKKELTTVVIVDNLNKS
jgi:hypothetical protein